MDIAVLLKGMDEVHSRSRRKIKPNTLDTVPIRNNASVDGVGESEKVALLLSICPNEGRRRGGSSVGRRIVFQVPFNRSGKTDWGSFELARPNLIEYEPVSTTKTLFAVASIIAG